MGLPMTFVFVNNAIYGMTGGQMAPTTLPGQVDHHDADGRARSSPASRCAWRRSWPQIDGPIYVERVRAVRQQTAKPREEGHHQGAASPGREQGSVVRRSARRVPDSPEAHAAGGGAMGEGEHGAGLPARREEGRRRSSRGSTSERRASSRRRGRRSSVARTDRPHASATGSRRTSIRRTWPSSSPAPVATGHRRSPCSRPRPPSTRAATRRTSRATARSRAAARRTPTSTSRSTRCFRRRAHVPHVLVAFNPPSLEKFGPTVQPGGIVIYDCSVIPEPPTLDPSLTVVGDPVHGRSPRNSASGW